MHTWARTLHAQQFTAGELSNAQLAAEHGPFGEAQVQLHDAEHALHHAARHFRRRIRSLVQQGSRALPAADVVLASLERRGFAAEVAAVAWLGSAVGVDLVALLLALGRSAATPPAAGTEDSGCSCSSCMHHSSWQKILTTDNFYCWYHPVVDIGSSARGV